MYAKLKKHTKKYLQSYQGMFTFYKFTSLVYNVRLREQLFLALFFEYFLNWRQ